MSSPFYDLDGEPIDMFEWEVLFRDCEGRQVAETEVGDVRISTVWLGINYRFDEEGAPLIFESMVFGGEFDHTTDRYPNWHAALAGHDQLVTMVQSRTKVRR
jgi:hypothetical protein